MTIVYQKHDFQETVGHPGQRIQAPNFCSPTHSFVSVKKVVKDTKTATIQLFRLTFCMPSTRRQKFEER